MSEAGQEPIVEQLEAMNGRAEERHRVMLRRWDESIALDRERHRELIEHGKASERVFIAAFNDIEASLERSNERADTANREHIEAVRDMRDSIRANTEAVLSVLDRLGPATS